MVYSGRKYGAEDLEKIQKNMVDIENTNKTEVILLIKIGSAEVDYLQVIKLTEVTNYR